MRRLHTILAVALLAATAAAYLAARARGTPLPPFAAAAAVRLPPVEVERGEVELRGRVLDAAGRPAAGVLVHLVHGAEARGERTDAPAFQFGETDAEGRVRLAPVLSGAHGVVVAAPGRPPARFEIEVPASDEVVWRLPEPYEEVLPLREVERAADLAGRVTAPEALGTPDLGGYEVLLEPRDEASRWAGATERRAAVEPDGSYRVEGLAAGRYRVTVLPPWAAGGSWPRLAERELDHEPGAGAEGPATLGIELACGVLRGRVVGTAGHPLEGALVQIVPAEPGGERRPWPPAATAADGGFEVPDLPPGRYRLRVRAGAASHEEELELAPGEARALDVVAR